MASNRRPVLLPTAGLKRTIESAATSGDSSLVFVGAQRNDTLGPFTTMGLRLAIDRAGYTWGRANRWAALILTIGLPTPPMTWAQARATLRAGNHVVGQSFRDCNTYCPEVVILLPENSQSAVQ